MNSKPRICTNCGIVGEYNDDCALCLMRKDYDEHRTLYQKMGVMS